MRNRQLFIAFYFLWISICVQSQTHTFIGELQLGSKKYYPAEYGNKIPYDLFLDKWKMKVYIANGTSKGKEITSVRLSAKENWYTAANEEIKKVELVIEISDADLPQSGNAAKKSGSVPLF